MFDTNIYLVLGMHRSGTSLVSGLLHQSGIVMGSSKNFIPKPNKENPKGFFENFDFRQLNDRLLVESGYLVKDWKSEFKPIKGSFLQRVKMQRSMKKLLKEYSAKHTYWGWKDPRQMLTCDRWYRAFKAAKLDKRLKLILVYRNPLNVALSMQTRGNVKDISHGLDIWYLYNQTLLNFLQKERLSCFTFSFENLTQETPMVMSNLSKFTKIEIIPEIYHQFVEQRFVRSQGTSLDFNKSIQNRQDIKNLLSQLVSLESQSLDKLPILANSTK